LPVPDWLDQDPRWQAFLGDSRLVPHWQAYPSLFFDRLAGLSGRARIVAWWILDQGSISTQALQDLGYGHPPRAKKDLQEHGVAIKTVMARNDRNDRGMAVYAFESPEAVLRDRQAGRAALPKRFVTEVKALAGCRCAVCAGEFGERELQADHRVPYRVAGDEPGGALDARQFMAICRSCNRAKSESCEHCANWTARDAAVCGVCYWASPDQYDHIATEPIRRLDLVWRGDEASDFDLLAAVAERLGSPLPAYVKAVLAAHAQGS
jgi:5-methylcytosine-specific restriction endonuclease McrA